MCKLDRLRGLVRDSLLVDKGGGLLLEELECQLILWDAPALLDERSEITPVVVGRCAGHSEKEQQLAAECERWADGPEPFIVGIQLAYYVDDAGDTWFHPELADLRHDGDCRVLIL